MVYAFGGRSTPGANTKTSDLANGTYTIVPKGTTVALYAKASAADINATLLVGGIPLVNDQPVVFTGTAGSISKADNLVAVAKTNGGKIELYLRNIGATAGITCDYFVEVM